MNKAEREIYLKEKLIKMKEYENQLYTQGYLAVAGTDEVGRGPLAGPVVAATVVLPESCDVIGIDDSKKLSPKKREELYYKIKETALSIGVSFVDNDTIDKINILNATKAAMVQSLNHANQKLIEGYESEIEYLLSDAVKLDNVKIPQMNIIKGDEKCISIAAASIIAKVTRDRFMIKMEARYPGYDFASNKGYGTKNHYAGIKRMGLTPIHRKTFLKNFI